MDKKTYKLIGLQIEGLRLIKAAQLTFKESGLTEIIGRNNAGKSTLIDAIEILFEGFKQKVDDIITHGKDKAVIIGDLNEFTIKRVMTSKSDRLEVLTKEGFKPQKPQDFLNTLINKLTFRPQVFLDKKPEEKLKSVMELLKIDFTELNRQIADKENDRLLKGREIKNLGEKTEPEKADPADTADLIKQKKEIDAFNEEEKAKQFDITYFNNIGKEYDYQFKLNTKPIIRDGIKKLQKTLQDFIGTMPQPEFKSTDEIDKQISNASEINRKAQNYKDYQIWKENKEKYLSEYENLTKEINNLKDLKVQKLAQTKMPVKGLTIKEVTEGNYGLFYEDIYAENWSQSTGWKIALGICVAMQPDLRAVFLDRGEGLDEDTRKALHEWAVKNNIQVILTIVDKIPDELADGKFYIEQGRIFDKDGDCVPAEPSKDEPEPEVKPEKKAAKPKIDTQSLF